MMTNDDYQHFVCIVASDNPEAIIKEYDKNLKKDPYVKYFYKDAKKLHQNYITVYENILKTSKIMLQFKVQSCIIKLGF